MTQSRSGQLALLAVVGAYFIRRFGWRGVVAAGLLSLPLIVFGGRAGEEADSSSAERLDCWEAGLGMFRTNPVLGVGAGQFANHHYLTAHNSFILTLAELGPLGLFLWSCAFYLVFKILVQALRDFADNETSDIVARWAMALIASLAGSLVSSFFLSIAYHPILWVQFGLVAAFYAAIQRHAPHWRVRFGWRDLVLVAGTDIVIITAIYGYVRMYGD
jgi:O-antigen ligase